MDSGGWQLESIVQETGNRHRPVAGLHTSPRSHPEVAQPITQRPPSQIRSGAPHWVSTSHSRWPDAQ